jgi:hypothetical protein
VTLRSYLRRLLSLLLSIPVAAVAGYLVSVGIAFAGKVPWKVTYVRMPGTELPTLFVMVATVALFGYLQFRRLPKTEDRKAFLLAGVSLNLLLTVLTGFLLSGTSYLFFVPAAAGLLSLYAISFLRHPVAKHVALSLNTLLGCLLLVPHLYALFIALTVGGLLALLIILVLYCGVLVPSFLLQAEEG